jgi:uncharacterized membrane protein (UPF0127 family)
MAPNWGMLFVFPVCVRHAFKMALMRIPLDIVFVGDDGKGVNVIESAQPKTLTLVSSGAYRYVLELNAGTVRDHEIRVGDSMKLTGVPMRYQPDAS